MRNLKIAFQIEKSKKRNDWVWCILILKNTVEKVYYKRRSIANFLKILILKEELFKEEFREVLDLLERCSLEEEIKRKNKTGV